MYFFDKKLYFFSVKNRILKKIRASVAIKYRTQSNRKHKNTPLLFDLYHIFWWKQL